MTRRRSLKVAVFLAAGISAFLAYAGLAPAQAKVALSNADCVKCHAARVNDIAEAGGGHRGVTCSGCHAGHPPAVKKPIPLCSQCHRRSKNVHFENENCLRCHTNPHRPLRITLKGADKDACRICHGPELWLLGKHESKHTALDCSRCHDVHRKIPQCTQCHKPHSEEMTAADCKKCHKAHTPKIQAFAADMTSQTCGLCHKGPAGLLSATASKHRNLACIGCHRLKHKFKPACRDCHGTPHPAGILVKFPECDMCHYSAHDLNNWPETAATAAAGETQKKP